MYKIFFLIALLAINFVVKAQVGINTIDPKSLLEIKSSSVSTPLNTDGLIIPKINEYSTISPTADQDGMLVFATGNGSVSKGFYYWENSSSSWRPFINKIDDLLDAKYKYSGDGTSPDINGLHSSSLYFGVNSGLTSNDDTFNVGVGHFALQDNTNGSSNVAIGSHALFENISGNYNIGVGQSALLRNISGFGNVALNFALYQLTTGSDNVGVGFGVLSELTTGSDNVVLGRGAGSGIEIGNNNISIGRNSSGLSSGTDSGYARNIAIGEGSGSSVGSATDNISIGVSSGVNVSGEGNISIGRSTSQSTNSILGNNNIVIGDRAGVHYSAPGDITRNNCVFIGQNAGIQEENSDRLYINSSTNFVPFDQPLIGGDFVLGRVGIKRPIGDITNAFEVNGEASKSTAGSWLANSDRRLKKDIEQISGTEALNKILQLRGVSYNWNDTVTNTTRPTTIQYGFIAQELKEVFPDKVTKDKLGYYQTSYGDYDAFFVEAIKELKRKNDSLIEELKTLRIEQNENMKILKNEIDKMKKSLKE